MECKCGGQGSSSYVRYTNFKEAEDAGYAVQRVPCVVATKHCPVCGRRSQDFHYEPGSKPKAKSLLQMIRNKPR